MDMVLSSNPKKTFVWILLAPLDSSFPLLGRGHGHGLGHSQRTKLTMAKTMTKTMNNGPKRKFIPGKRTQNQARKSSIERYKSLFYTRQIGTAFLSPKQHWSLQTPWACKRSRIFTAN